MLLLGVSQPSFITGIIHLAWTVTMRHSSLSVILASAAAAVAVDTATAVTYDYIVVGSGPGGGPLACDLARAGYSTLLLEAGDDQGDNPVYADIMNFNTAGNDEKSRWDFWTKHSDDSARELKFEHYNAPPAQRLLLRGHPAAYRGQAAGDPVSAGGYARRLRDAQRRCLLAATRRRLEPRGEQDGRH